jgi:biotin carboxyl carrier protein
VKLRITVEGQPYEVDVEVMPERETAAAPSEPRPVAPREPRIVKTPPVFAKGRHMAKSDEKTCRSPLAGLVVTIAVEAGQAVEQNAHLLTLEAMKMETKIGALAAGVVKNVLVAPGDSVKPGQVLVEFE